MSSSSKWFTCQTICWIVLAILGCLLTWVLIGLGFFWALLISVVLVVLAAIYLVPMICSDDTAENETPVTSPAANVAAVQEETAAETPAVVEEPVAETPAEAEEPVENEPAPVAATPKKPTAAPAGSAVDDLTRISGVGKVLAEGLKENGVTTFAQIASWGPEEIHWADNDLAKFKGRCTRDDWVGQAKELAKG